MLLLNQDKFISYSVIINFLLCIVAIGKLTSGAATTGQQLQVSDPTSLSLAQAPQPPIQPQSEPANSMVSPIPTAATFSIPPQANLPTTPVPTIHHQHQPDQSTTERPQTPALTTAIASTTTTQSTTTTTTQQPSSFSSMLVAKQASTVPPSVESFDNQAQGRSQAQIIATSTSTTSASSITTTPGPFDDLSFTTFSLDSTTFRSNTSFDESSMENLDSAQQSPTSHSPSSPPERPNFEENHNPFLESSLENRRQSIQDTFAQTTPAPTQQNPPTNSVPILSLPIHSANSSQSPHILDANSTSSLPSFQETAPSAIETPKTNDSREINNHDEPSITSQESRNAPEDRLQSVTQTRPLTAIPQNSSIANNLLEKKVQILKPKSKFTCTQLSDCQNEGVCVNSKCYCSAGFTGESCNINIDECRQFEGTPCLNNGTCIDGVNLFRCECPPGFRGERCQDLADMCNDSPCFNNAECINHRTNYTCKCAAGWTGRQCETNIDDCAKVPCLNGGTCQDLVDNFKCECPIGFIGATCETNVDDCMPDPCQNNATCRDSINDYECECRPGFSGKHCEDDIDECLSRPCSPHGDCIDLVNGYKCNCHDGWTGQHCENDINECDSNRPVCLNGGTCINLDGSHQCNCRDGYTGKKCSEISDFCKAKQPCGKHGICKNLNSGKNQFQCECYSSYVGNRCDRKRECAPHECNFEHAHCVNNVTCACLPGRREERIMCEYVTSCEQVEGDLCLHGGVCKDLESGGYHCACQDPWYGPVCQFRVETQFDAVLLVVITCVGFLVAACAVVSLVIFRSVRKARATRGTYSPSTQEKFGNSASDLLKPPIPERLI